MHAQFDVEAFARRLREELPSLEKFQVPVVTLNSAAVDREKYVRRPDLGRVLADESANRLDTCPCDLVFIVADGLSAIAPERNAIPLLGVVVPRYSKRDGRAVLFA